MTTFCLIMHVWVSLCTIVKIFSQFFERLKSFNIFMIVIRLTRYRAYKNSNHEMKLYSIVCKPCCVEFTKSVTVLIKINNNNSRVMSTVHRTCHWLKTSTVNNVKLMHSLAYNVRDTYVLWTLVLAGVARHYWSYYQWHVVYK